MSCHRHRPHRRGASGRALVGLAVVCALAQWPVVAQGPPTAGASLQEVAFIAGAWRGELGGGTIEEHWSAPEGDNMMGMFRYVKDGKVTFYEMQSIEQEEGAVVLRIKHYHPGLRGWEEKDEAKTFLLRQVTGQRATFAEGDGLTELIYQGGEDQLVIELVEKKTGEAKTQRFELRSMSSGG